MSAAARRLAHHHRVVGTIACAECGTPVVVTTAGRYKRRYCSARCKVRAWARARRAARRA